MQPLLFFVSPREVMATATRIASPNLLDTLEDEPKGSVPSPFPVYHIQSQLDLDQEVPKPFDHASAVVQEHVEPVKNSFSLLPLHVLKFCHGS